MVKNGIVDWSTACDFTVRNLTQCKQHETFQDCYGIIYLMLFNGRFTVSNLIISLEALVIPYLSISSSTRYKLLIERSNLLKWLPLLRRVGIYEMTQ